MLERFQAFTTGSALLDGGGHSEAGVYFSGNFEYIV